MSTPRQTLSDEEITRRVAEAGLTTASGYVHDWKGRFTSSAEMELLDDETLERLSAEALLQARAEGLDLVAAPLVGVVTQHGREQPQIGLIQQHGKDASLLPVQGEFRGLVLPYQLLSHLRDGENLAAHRVAEVVFFEPVACEDLADFHGDLRCSCWSGALRFSAGRTRVDHWYTNVKRPP